MIDVSSNQCICQDCWLWKKVMHSKSKKLAYTDKKHKLAEEYNKMAEKCWKHVKYKEAYRRFLTENFGKQCHTYDKHCIVCQRWKEFEEWVEVD